MAERAEVVAFKFFGALVVHDWHGALILTQVTWRHGFARRSLQGPVDRLLAVLIPRLRPREVRTTDDLRGAVGELRVRRVLKTGRPIFVSKVLCHVPVLVERVKTDGVRVDRFECWQVATLVKEAAPFRPSVDGVWGVNPTSCLRSMTSRQVDSLRESVVDRRV